MKNLKNKTFAAKLIAMILVLCTVFSFFTYAEFDTPETNPIIEEYNNASSISSSLTFSSGKAKMRADFNAYSSSCTIKTTMKLELFFVVWFPVPNSEFTDNVSGSVDHVENKVNISTQGNYRATITVKISGPYGSDDYYENTHTASYSG